MSEMIERVAAALLAALKAQQNVEDALGRDLGGYIQFAPGTNDDGEPLSEGFDRVCLDGNFDLTALARAAMGAMQEPSDKMLAAGSGWTDNSWAEGDLREIWPAMIAAALA